MKITIPHLGNTYLAAKCIFDGLGIDYIIPPLCNKEALEIGALYSPDEMCLPFKIMIGNYVQSIKKGADTVLIVGSCGPCRFGEYGELQMNLLRKLGYDLNFIVLDAITDIGKEEFLRRIKEIGRYSDKSTGEKLNVLKDAYKVISLIDYIEKQCHYKAGYEVNRGECKSILKECKEKAEKTNKPNDMLNVLQDYKNKIRNLEIDKSKDPVKIAILGEIYTVIEPFANLNIEDKFMEYGVSSYRGLTPTWWVKDLAMKVFKLNSLDIRRASKEYLPLYIGGHARECVGEAVLANEKGYDGAIQIFPMGCMPEIVSKAILPKIAKDKNFPIMTLVVDEMTGEAGYVTRIEAFIDLLERRKSSNVLSWC